MKMRRLIGCVLLSAAVLLSSALPAVAAPLEAAPVSNAGSILLEFEQDQDFSALYRELSLKDENGYDTPYLLNVLGARQVVVVPMGTPKQQLSVLTSRTGYRSRPFEQPVYLMNQENLQRFSVLRGVSPWPGPILREDMAKERTGASPAANSQGGVSAPSSQTNSQVAGIEEGDSVKTDGKYLYLLRASGISIVSAQGSLMKQVAVIPFSQNDFNARELYVLPGRLVAVGDSYKDNHVQSIARIYSLKDPAKPSLEREISQDGSYVSSRLEQGRLSFISAHGIYADQGKVVAPSAKDSLRNPAAQPLDLNKIQIFPYLSRPDLILVATAQIQKPAPASFQAVAGNAQTVYMSSKSLYVAHTQVPFIAPMKRILPGPGETFPPQPAQNLSTRLMKFDLTEQGYQYRAQADLPGQLLNQFSLDESQGYLRAAYTTGLVEDKRSSSLVVFDPQMKKVSSVDNIAPTERIYSVRFLQDRAYMVTFRNTDPFYVIDLKDPKKPNILGFLKIPGYSDYLHPYDQNHVIGIGKDSVIEKGAAYYLGMKVALYDVSDVKNPRQTSVLSIGDRGTESEVLQDHRALLVSPQKGIFAMPVSLAKVKKPSKNPGFPDYGEEVFQGGYVFEVTPSYQLKTKGTLTHLTQAPAKAPYQDRITRMVQIGDYLYSFSENKLSAARLQDLTIVSTLALRTPYDQPIPK